MANEKKTFMLTIHDTEGREYGVAKLDLSIPSTADSFIDEYVDAETALFHSFRSFIKKLKEEQETSHHSQ